MANDIINITIDAYNKKVSNLTGKLSIKCTFTVLLTNIGDATPANIDLQVLLGGDVYASVAVGGFSASGTNATGTLSLNTKALTDYFANLGDQREVKFTIVAQDTVDDDNLLNDTVMIANNPYNASALPPDASTDAVTVDALPTVAGEVSVWATIAGVLSATGYAIETTLVGAATKLVRADAIKAVTDALATTVGLNTTHRTGDGSDHSDVAANTLGVAANAAGVVANDAAMLKRAAGDFSAGIAAKATPVLADRVLLEDSADSWEKKTALVSGIQNTGAVTDATNVNTDTTDFDNLLSATDDTVQKALDTLNDVEASEMVVDATGFSGNLSGADTDSQTAFDTIDAATFGQITYNYIVTANDWADLVSALESGTYATVFIPDGTYTCTDDETTPLAVHANVKRISGQSREGTIIDSDCGTNTSIADFMTLGTDCIVENMKIINFGNGNTGAFKGTANVNKTLMTLARNCAVEDLTNSVAVGFKNCDVNGCKVVNDSSVGAAGTGRGFEYCYNVTNCTTFYCTYGILYSEGVSANHTSQGTYGIYNCEGVVGNYVYGHSYGMGFCKGVSGNTLRSCSIRGLSVCSDVGYDNYFASGVTLEYYGCTFNHTYKDDTDNTKELTHDYSGITTGTERTATWPDKDGTVAMTNDLLLNKLDATVAPDADNDVDEGYSVGSQWVDTTADKTYFCQDATDGAAVWVEVGAGGGGGGISDIAEKTADYTILDADDNTLLVLGRATAADKTFTLPTLADNLGDEMICENASDYLLTVQGESLGADAVEAGTTSTAIVATGHSAVVGCVFEMTSGDESGETRRVTVIDDADNFTIDNALSGTPSATETFELFEAIDGKKEVYLGKDERKSFYGADLTADEWRMS